MMMAKPKQLDPGTASRERSIWESIDRMRLESQTQALHAKQHVSGRRSYTTPATSMSDSLYPLPVEIEERLANDLAFIAACQPKANFVTAVAIEQGPDKASLVVKLATNEGASDEVSSHFDDIFATMRSHAAHARRSISPIC